MRRLVVAATLCAAVAGSAAGTAHAAFPGFNGRLAFARTTDADGATRIVTADASGAGLAELVPNAPAAQPSWSADGTRLAFVARDRDAPHDLEVFVSSDGGGSATQITHNTADDLAPAFSPDGTQLVLERLDADPADGDTSGDLVARTLETGVERFLTQTRDLDTDPAWSRHGRIAFHRDPLSDTPRLMTIEPDGSDPRTVLLGDYTGPDWSPDGGLLAFRQPGGGVGVVAVGSGESRRFSVGGRLGDPVFSPDGTKIALARDTEFTDGEIVVVNAETGAVEAWVEAAGGVTDRDPAWQPLGSDAVLLHSGPSGVVAGSRVRFEFSAVGAEGTYECRVDGDSFSPCTSPRIYDELGDGPHRFEVVMKTAAGKYGPITARAWTADTVTPTVRITGGPTGLVSSPDAEVTFESSEPEVRRSAARSTARRPRTAPRRCACAGCRRDGTPSRSGPPTASACSPSPCHGAGTSPSPSSRSSRRRSPTAPPARCPRSSSARSSPAPWTRRVACGPTSSKAARSRRPRDRSRSTGCC